MSAASNRESEEGRRKILILSFSPLARDARVLRQIQLFSEQYDVTTVGFGPSAPNVSEHYEIRPSQGRSRRLRGYVESALLRLRLYRLMYWSDPLVRQTRRALRSVPPSRVIANDIYPVPLAIRHSGSARVHADLHEYYPGLHDDNAQWRRLRQPYLTWLIETYGTRAASTTTVGDEIAEIYRRHGIDAQVVLNAPERQPYAPGRVATPIRLVHAGAALPTRRIENMMQAAADCSADIELTLLLTPNTPSYVARLNELAARLGPRIRMLPPVPHEDLLETLNTFDVGIHVLPATVTNQALALPNKFFDFVQARLGVIVGPTPGMARLIERHQIGAVTESFEVDGIRRALDALTPEAVDGWKNASDRASTALSSASQLPVWSAAVQALNEGPR